MASRGTRRIGKLATLRTGNADADRGHNELVQRINALLDHPLAGAILMEAKLSYGLNKVGHGLGRAPVDFFWNTDRPGTVLSKAQADNPAPDKTLWIVLAGDFQTATCNLLVF